MLLPTHSASLRLFPLCFDSLNAAQALTDTVSCVYLCTLQIDDCEA